MPPRLSGIAHINRICAFERRKKADAKQLRAISSLRRNVRLINQFIAGGISTEHSHAKNAWNLGICGDFFDLATTHLATTRPCPKFGARRNLVNETSAGEE